MEYKRKILRTAYDWEKGKTSFIPKGTFCEWFGAKDKKNNLIVGVLKRGSKHYYDNRHLPKDLFTN